MKQSIFPHHFLIQAVSSVFLLGFISAAQADLVHSFDFSPDAPLADGTGGLNLEKRDVVAPKSRGDADQEAEAESRIIGTTGVTFDPAGFATFDGGVNFLAAELTGSVGSPYRVSFWFRLADLAQPQEVGLLAVTADPSYGTGLWAVKVREGALRFDGKSNEGALVKSKMIGKADAGTWYFVTLQFDESGKSGFWINDGQFTPFTNFDLASDPSSDSSSDPSIAFAPPPMLHIGTERTGSFGFTGDIDSVRVSNGSDWDDAKQAAAYAAGPEAPAQ